MGHAVYRAEEVGMIGKLQSGLRRAVVCVALVAAPVAPCVTAAHAQSASPAVADESVVRDDSRALDSELRAELDSYIQGALVAFDVPGAAVAVLADGKIAYSGAFGSRGDGHPQPVDERTLFMVGSITKSMTATMIATLVDDQVIEWDVPVQALLPTFGLARAEYDATVTLRQLLSHQSGASRSDLALFVGAEGPLDVIDGLSELPMHSPPGVRFEYQNQVFAAAGFAAARAAGARYRNESLYRTYERLMHDRVFDPVGMRRTTLDFDRVLRSSNHAWPSEFSPLAADVREVQVGFERFATTIAPSGAVWSNIEDMARYALLHLNQGRNARGERVVSQGALAETHTPTIATDPAGAYGLGWVVAEGPLGTLVTHGGGTAGFGADIALLPERGLGLVVLTNRVSSQPFIGAVERYIVETLLGTERTPDDDLLALENGWRAEAAALVDLTAPVEFANVAAFLGNYERNARVLRRGQDLVLRTEFGELVLRAAIGYPGAFLVVGNTLASAVVQFSSDENGRVSLTLGLPFLDGEEVQLMQPITLRQVERAAHRHRPPRWTHDPRAEWQRAVQSLRSCGLRRPTQQRSFR